MVNCRVSFPVFALDRRHNITGEDFSHPSVYSIPANCQETIKEYTKKIAEALHVCGLMNMQYAIENGKVYVIEANPRASRTVPLVSKVCDTQMARLATRMMLGESLESLGLKDKKIPYYGAKEGRTLSRAYRVYFVNSQMYTASFAMQN